MKYLLIGMVKVKKLTLKEYREHRYYSKARRSGSGNTFMLLMASPRFAGAFEEKVKDDYKLLYEPCTI